MSGGGTSTNTIQRADPWGPQQPYLQQALAAARNLYQTKAPQAYPGQTLATPSAQTTAAPAALTTAATGPTAQLAGAGQQAANFDLTQATNIASNPAAQGAIQGAINPLMRNWSDVMLPQLRESYAAAQPGGGTREGVAEGIAATNLNQQIADTIAQMSTAMYGQGLTAMNQGLATLPATQAAQATPATQLGAAGGAVDAQTQAVINDAIARWNASQQLPWNTLGSYESLIQGNLGGTGASQATGELGLTGTLQNVLGLGLMGAGAYNLAGSPNLIPGGSIGLGSSGYAYGSAVPLATDAAIAGAGGGAFAGLGGMTYADMLAAGMIAM